MPKGFDFLYESHDQQAFVYDTCLTSMVGMIGSHFYLKDLKLRRMDLQGSKGVRFNDRKIC